MAISSRRTPASCATVSKSSLEGLERLCLAPGGVGEERRDGTEIGHQLPALSEVAISLEGVERAAFEQTAERRLEVRDAEAVPLGSEDHRRSHGICVEPLKILARLGLHVQ